MKQDKFMTTLKLGSKGQIVIPKEVRDMFGIKPGDTVLLLADIEKGIAITDYKAYKEFAEAILSCNPCARGASEKGVDENEKQPHNADKQ